MKITRSITVWTLLVGALWVGTITVHVDARAKHAAMTAAETSKPITMGIRN